MAVDWTIVSVLAVIFLATVVRSAFGFGEALIAVPLLALLFPVEEAVPLATLISITVAGIVPVAGLEKSAFPNCPGIVLSTLLGIPLGLLLLTAVEETVVKAILAVSIIGFAWYCLVGRGKLELQRDKWAWVFGFVAGIFGGLTE